MGPYQTIPPVPLTFHFADPPSWAQPLVFFLYHTNRSAHQIFISLQPVWTCADMTRHAGIPQNRCAAAPFHVHATQSGKVASVSTCSSSGRSASARPAITKISSHGWDDQMANPLIS